MSDTYYGAPNDFREYLEHSQDISTKKRIKRNIDNYYRDDTQRKRDSKQASDQQRHEEQAQRNDMIALRNKYNDAKTRLKNYINAHSSQQGSSSAHSEKIRTLSTIMQQIDNIFRTAEREDRWLTRDEQNKIENFITSVNRDTQGVLSAARDAMERRQAREHNNRWHQ